MQATFDDLMEWQMMMWRDLFIGAVVVLAGLVALSIGLAVLYSIWLGVSARLRRQERARCLLQLLETGLRQGRRLEETILSLAQSRVQALGVRLHLVAAHLERGLRLSAALDQVPEFLPVSVRAMLRVGEELGDVAKVLPACRRTLGDGNSGVRSRLNNVVVLLFVSPLGPALVWFCAIWIFPKLKEIARDMVPSGPLWSGELFEWSIVVANVTLMIWLLF